MKPRGQSEPCKVNELVTVVSLQEDTMKVTLADDEFGTPVSNPCAAIIIIAHETIC